VCKCPPGDVDRYRARISGPILDRIDMRVELSVPPAECLGRAAGAESTRELHARIRVAREQQAVRYADLSDVYCNAQAGPIARRTLMCAQAAALQLLSRAVARFDLSVRVYEKTLAVARSIADLDGATDVDAQHVAEALQYRVQDGRALS